jgi:hypothetical protein
LTGKLAITIKDPKQFIIQAKQHALEKRLGEKWTRARLIEETYLSLMSVKAKDDEGVIRRKYEEQVREKIGWMAIPPNTASTITVSLKDLDAKVKEELLADNQAMRDLTLKQAVEMICEQFDTRYYLLSAKRFMKVELVD